MSQLIIHSVARARTQLRSRRAALEDKYTELRNDLVELLTAQAMTPGSRDELKALVEDREARLKEVERELDDIRADLVADAIPNPVN